MDGGSLKCFFISVFPTSNTEQAPISVFLDYLNCRGHGHAANMVPALWGVTDPEMTDHAVEFGESSSFGSVFEQDFMEVAFG